MREYIEIIHNEIEVSRNELRARYVESRDENIKKLLDKYEEEYYQSCLKIEALIDKQLANKA